MRKLGEITLADIGNGLRRYQPFVAAVVAVILVVAYLPGDPPPGQVTADGGSDRVEIADFGTSSGGSASDADVPAGDGDGASGAAAGASGGGRAPTGTSSGGATGPTGSGTGSAATGSPSLPDQPVANCDPARGRIAIPVTVAPPCTAAYDGENPGATAQGVTGDTIKLVYYQTDVSPATEAALTAAGANNTRDEAWATAQDWNAIFNAHYNFWGRKVELIRVQGSGASDDDAAGKADAIKIATEIKAFAVINSPNNAFARELAARGVLCVCTTSQPQEFYESLDPYVGYTTLMASTQGYLQRGEYLCKRLHGRKAVHAGDVLLQTAERKFGILYFETADNAYKSGVDFFEQEIAKCGASMAVRLAYSGPPNYTALQEQSRPYIQRLAENGVTSVVFAGDPISPAIFTQEATRQRYFPEWIITGSALTDTTLFARTYDRPQWENAFGVSFLTARGPDEQGDAYTLHTWHHGREPTANNQFGVIYAGMLPFYIGAMLAGETLTPQSWQAGLFAFPPTGGGKVTQQHVSWGEHGIWPFRDYTAYDDVTEIWWDPNTPGEDEVGNTGPGMYRYVDGGRRYMPGEHPTSDPKVFVAEGSVTVYDERPAEERPPEYPPPNRT